MIIIRTKCKKANSHSTHEKFYMGSNMKELIDKIKIIVLDMFHNSINWEAIEESKETDILDKGMEILAIQNVEEFGDVVSETFRGTTYYGFMAEIIQIED